VRSAAYALESARLNNDLRSAMQIMSQDLRRANGGLNMGPSDAIQFAASGDCVTYFVEDAGRGFRLDDGNFQMYFVDPLLPQIPACDNDSGWISLYQNLSAGEFRVTALNFDWNAVCYPFDGTNPSEFCSSPGPDCTTTAIQEYPRCVGMNNVTEVLEVSLSLTGEIGTSSGVKAMTVIDSVMVRNHDVQEDTTGAGP
jgi:hypothetical protein